MGRGYGGKVVPKPAQAIPIRSENLMNSKAYFIISAASLGGKWLELLSEIARGLKRAAFMFNTDTATGSVVYMPSLETAARSLKVEPIIAPVHSDAEIETAITALGREPGGGLVVMPGMGAHRASILSAAARNNVPVAP
jgi:putative ABC transport system substrate-binding protein